MLDNSESRVIFVLISASFFTFNMLIRSAGAIIYNMKYLFTERNKYNKKIKKKCNEYAR